MRLKRTGGIVLPVLICLSLLFCSCGNNEKVVQETPELKTPVGVNVDTEPVRRGDVVKQVAYEADVVPTTHELYFSVNGSIQSILAYKGQYVEKGQALMELDASSVENEIESIEKALENLNTEADFENRIADLNIAYKELELREARERYGESSQTWQLKNLELQNLILQKTQAEEKRAAQRAEKEERLKELRETAEKLVIYAPCEGHFYYSDSIAEGSYVSSGRTVAYLVDPTDLKLVISKESVSSQILENGTCYGWINGQRWELTYEPLTADQKSSYVLAKQVPPSNFTIKGDWEGQIEAGMNAAVLGESYRVSDVLYIPSDCILSDTGGRFVYVIKDGNVREKRYITVGYSNDLCTEVKDGLEEGEQVYVEE